MLQRAARAALARLRGEKTPAQSAADIYRQMSLEREFLTSTLPRLAAGGWRDGRCVFVPNTGRAGSMQLTAVLGLSRDVLAQHEPSPMLIDLGARAYADGCADPGWEQVIHAARDDFVAFANHGNRLYAETNNRLTFLAPAIARAYPGSLFIHLHRHPHDVIRSGLVRRWYQGGAVDFSLIVPRKDDPQASSWGSMTPVEKIAWSWARTNGWIADFMAALPPGRGLVLPARDFFRADPDVIRGVFAFLGAEPPAPAAVQRALGRRLNAKKATETWGDRERAEADPLVADVARRLGYTL